MGNEAFSTADSFCIDASGADDPFCKIKGGASGAADGGGDRMGGGGGDASSAGGCEANDVGDCKVKEVAARESAVDGCERDASCMISRAIAAAPRTAPQNANRNVQRERVGGWSK